MSKPKAKDGLIPKPRRGRKKKGRAKPAPQGPPTWAEGLTYKQRAFIEAYLGEARGNASEAARKAGYTGSDITIAASGRENLQKPTIRKALEAYRQEMRDRVGALSPEEILLIWADLARNGDAEKTKLRATELAAKVLGLLDAKASGDAIPGRIVVTFTDDVVPSE